MRTSITSAAFLALLALPSFARADTPIDDFESATSPAPWTFTNGPEFPGAKGALTKGTGHVGSGAHLAYDFTGGGNYVAMSRDLGKTVAARGLSFWAKVPAGMHAKLRVVDATGQTLQYDLARPLAATDASAWFHQVVALDGASGHWGGANDGVLHAGITGISVLAADAIEPKSTGAIEVDDVVAIDSLATTLDLGKTPIFAAPSGASSLAPRLAVNIHFFKDGAALDAAKKDGCTRVRMDLGWSSFERTKGTYDFANLDALVAALAARGMTLHLILDYANPLYPALDASDFATTTVPAFAAASKAVAAHLAGKGVTYEVWNEANLKQFWPPSPDPAAYAALAKATIAAVHQGDASAKISTTGMSGFDFAFFRGFVAAGGATGADAIGVHPYRQKGGESITDELVLLRSLADSLPGKPPVWDTEWGYSSTWYGNDGHAAAARDSQGKFVARMALSGWAVGFPLIVDYDLRDDGSDPANAEHNFGLHQQDLSDKPAAVALRTLSSAAASRRFVGLYDLGPTSLHAMRLDGGSDVVLVVWTDAGTATVTLPHGGHAIDVYGATYATTSDTVTLASDQGPIYVTYPAAPPPPVDAGPNDAGAGDAGGSDAVADDAGTSDDAAITDSSAPDGASIEDVGTIAGDAGPADGSSSDGACGCRLGARDRSIAGVASMIGLAAALTRSRRRRSRT